MTKTFSSKIEFAAELVSNDIKFFILQSNLNNKSRILFQLIEKKGYWGEIFKPIFTYWGELNEFNEIKDTLKNTYKEKNSEIEDIKGILIKMLNYYSKNTIEEDKRCELESKVKQNLNELKLINFVDGNEEEPSNSKLSLTSAQKLSIKVRNTETLTSNELQLVKILLTEAPLLFGYWGPFKCLMKFLDPKLMPVEFGKALGRLAKIKGFSSADVFNSNQCLKESSYCEDISWMNYFMPVPSQLTCQYMSRRMRRLLSRLGNKEPNIYTTIAENILIEWDSSIQSISYIPAYILAGSDSTLDIKSRYVKVPLIQESRKESYPELWNNNLDKIHSILKSIKFSSEVFTFCIQVLLENGEHIPELNEAHLKLALLSSDQKVIKVVLPYIPKHPGIWNKVPSNIWNEFILNCDLNLFPIIAEEINNSKLEFYTLGSELREIIKSNVTNDNTISHLDYKRLSEISQLYLLNYCNKYKWDRSNETKDIISKAIELSSLYFDFNNSESKWNKILKNIDLSVLLYSYISIFKNDSIKEANLSLISNIIFNSVSDDNEELIKLAKVCFENSDESINQLGWEFFKLAADKNYIENQLLDWLKRKDESELLPDQWSQVRLKLVLSFLEKSNSLQENISELLTDTTWKFNDDEKTWLISRIPELKFVAWNQLDQNHLNNLKNVLLSDTDFVKSVGDSLDPEQIKETTPEQQALLIRYLNLKPTRIRSDRTFAISLVAIPNPSLQKIVLSQIINSNEFENFWLAIGELGLPIPLQEVRNFLESVSDPNQFTKYVITCIDSMVSPLRDLGLELLEKERHRIDQNFIAKALVYSDDSKVQVRAVKEILMNKWEENSSIALFDRRILITRRKNRRAKEMIKNRLCLNNKIMSKELLTPERKEALLDLAKGSNLRDQEWALKTIALLTCQGVEFNDIQVSNVSPRKD